MKGAGWDSTNSVDGGWKVVFLAMSSHALLALLRNETIDRLRNGTLQGDDMTISTSPARPYSTNSRASIDARLRRLSSAPCDVDGDCTPS
jgi:hypothetical protein